MRRSIGNVRTSTTSHGKKNHPELLPIQKVWLEGRNLKILYATKKLAPKQEGPFTIKEVLTPLSYRLDLLKQWKIHPVFHAALLTPYRETEMHGPNFLNLPPDLIEGEKEYEVEAIIAHKKKGRGYYFLV